MTVSELYAKFDGDYRDITNRFGTDKLIERFMLKFPSDDSVKLLQEAVADANIEAAFCAAHNIKGLADNLSLTRLCAAASELTEQLRSRKNPVDMELYDRVIREYDCVISAIDEYRANM